MPSVYSLLVGLAGLVPALALGTGQKFKIVDGGKSFDRFITIWLENQVRAPRLPTFSRPRKAELVADSLGNDRTLPRSSRTPISPT